MPRGNWSFIHEWVIYEYLMARYNEGILRLKCIIKQDKLLRRENWVKVVDIQPITGTDFPDIKSIKLSTDKLARPAEVKFNTHLFNYHKSENYQNAYEEFLNNRGFILVVSHDYLPNGLRNADVFEIDKSDFSSYCRENFNRLLNRQLKQHTDAKVWLMYQGPNFHTYGESVKPAQESNIWCPTENLTAFDLSIGDRILFIKTQGASSQKVQFDFIKGTININWILKQLWCFWYNENRAFRNLKNPA